MFDRKLFKQNAKFCLRRYYGEAVGATFLYYLFSILTAVLGPIAGVIALIFLPEKGGAALSMLLTVGVAYLIMFLAMFFVMLPLAEGLVHFFLRSREQQAKVGYIKYAYKNCLGKSIGWQLLIALRMLPGIIIAYIPAIAGTILAENTGDDIYLLLLLAAYPLLALPMRTYYKYSMVQWLLAENPNMTRARAFYLSREMTNGNKWKIFITDLSFLGWAMLAVLLPYLGYILLTPYIMATRAEVYTFLKAGAKASGLAAEAELPGFAPAEEIAEEIPAPEEAPEEIPAPEEAPETE